MVQEADEYDLVIRNNAELREEPVVNISDQMWLIGKQYREGDITLFNDCLYLAIQDSMGNQPDMSPSDWKQLGSKNTSSAGKIVVDFANVTGDTKGEVVAGMIDMNGDQTYTFTLADNVTSVSFIVIGAGGSGGDGISTVQGIASGGGGGSGQLVSFSGGPFSAGHVFNLRIGAAMVSEDGHNSEVSGMGIVTTTGTGGIKGEDGIYVINTSISGGEGGFGENGGGGGSAVSGNINAITGRGGNSISNGGGEGGAYTFTGILIDSGPGPGMISNGLPGQRIENPFIIFLGNVGGNLLGGKGGSPVFFPNPEVFGGNGGASPSPITDADNPSLDSIQGTGWFAGFGSTSPVVPGGGGGGGGGSLNNVNPGAAGSSGRIIIEYQL